MTTVLDGIANPAAFVNDAINRARIRPRDPHELDELLAEGLLILCELRASYDPARDSNSDPRTGGWVGYAHYLLPRKLIAAWHRHHPEHRYTTDPDTGRRKWVTDPAPTSLDGLLATHEHDRDDLTMIPATHPSATRP